MVISGAPSPPLPSTPATKCLRFPFGSSCPPNRRTLPQLGTVQLRSPAQALPVTPGPSLSCLHTLLARPISSLKTDPESAPRPLPPSPPPPQQLPPHWSPRRPWVRLAVRLSIAPAGTPLHPPCTWKESVHTFQNLGLHTHSSAHSKGDLESVLSRCRAGCYVAALHVCLTRPVWADSRIEPATQVCALPRNQAPRPLGCRTMLQPAEPHRPGPDKHLLFLQTKLEAGPREGAFVRSFSRFP